MEGLFAKEHQKTFKNDIKVHKLWFSRIFDNVRYQIRAFVCLFLSHAPKMEIQEMVTWDNVGWFISHSFCHVYKSEMSEIILFGGVF